MVDSSQRLGSRRWLPLIFYYFGWAVLGAAIAAVLYTEIGQRGPFRREILLIRAFLPIFASGLLAPWVVLFARRYRLLRGNWKKGILVHLLAACVFAVANWLLVSFFIDLFFQPPSPRPPPFLADTSFLGMDFWLIWRLLRNGSLGFLIYWVLAGTTYAFEYHKISQERELHASKLEAQLAQAQLHTLKNQLHPHFLFNTLHTISAMVYESPREADKMIQQLSDLLRMVLESSRVQEIALKDEIAFIDRYLQIMKTRYKDRLKVKVDVPQETRQALVPNLILQPLVENAIKHGLESEAGKCRIEILARKGNGLLNLQVNDNGPGNDADLAALTAKGFGLANVTKRLNQIYGPEHKFALSRSHPQGLSVAIEIPFQLRSDSRGSGGADG